MLRFGFVSLLGSPALVSGLKQTCLRVIAPSQYASCAKQVEAMRLAGSENAAEAKARLLCTNGGCLLGLKFLESFDSSFKNICSSSLLLSS